MVDGKVFNDLRSLSLAAGISYAAAVKRSHRGFSDYEIFHGRRKPIAAKVPKERDHRHKLSVDGIWYENLRDAFDKLTPKASYNTVRARRRHGWSNEAALEVCKKEDGRRTRKGIRQLRLDGALLTIAEASRKFKVPYSSVLDRLNRGATAEQAVGLAQTLCGDLVTQRAFRTRAGAKRVQKQTYVVAGTEYGSVAELAKAHKLPYGLVFNRIRFNGWSAERAVNEPVADAVEVNGVTYRSAMGAWEEVGRTNYFVYQARKTSGLPIAVCLGLAPLPELNKYEIGGREFVSLAAVAAAYHLKTTQLKGRLRIMSLEEAVEFAPSIGRYTLKRFKSDRMLAAAAGTLYFIRIRLADGMLHKIGITQKSVSLRFASMQFELIAEYKGTLEKLFQAEQEILRLFRGNQYRGDESFDGRTELFLLMDDEERAMLQAIEERMRKCGSRRQRPRNIASDRV